MIKLIKIAVLAASAVAVATPAVAAPVAATPPAQASAKIVRPLTLTSTGSLNFGTIVLNGVTANRTVSLSSANALDCAGGSTELQCSGTTSVPTYNVRGTNNMTVNILKTASTLSNGTGGTLTLTPSGANSLVLTNAGAPGDDFNIGGSIVIGVGQAEGLYTGTVDVQVDYQ